MAMYANLVAYVDGDGAVVMKNRHGEAPAYPVPVSCLLDLLLLGQVPEGVRQEVSAAQPEHQGWPWRLQPLRDLLRTRSATGAAPVAYGRGRYLGSFPSDPRGVRSATSGGLGSTPGPIGPRETRGASSDHPASGSAGKGAVAGINNLLRPIREITAAVKRKMFRAAMRNCALLVRDIDLARRAGTPGNGDGVLRDQMLRQAIVWRDRALLAEPAPKRGTPACPFCQSAITPADVRGAGFMDESPYKVVCPGCGARGPREDSPEGALATWTAALNGRCA